MNDTNIIEKVKSKFGELVIDSHNFRGDQTITVKNESTLELFQFLRDDLELQFNFMMDLTAVDYLKKKAQRFEVVYHLYSLKYNFRFRVKIPVDEKDCSVVSITSLWRTVNWYEREIWDLYGIKFKGHPNLSRILMYEGFKGHPLRKDYPINKRQPLIGPIN